MKERQEVLPGKVRHKVKERKCREKKKQKETEKEITETKRSFGSTSLLLMLLSTHLENE